MTATNKPMTDAQMDELMAVAMRMQSDSEKMGERSVSIFAYAVQVAVLEIRETRCKYEELKLTDMAVQLANAESKCRELAAENAYLLNGASRELNTSWMFHKTMLGAQAALVCLSHGYQAAAREWLEGTTDEAGAAIPDDISVGELHEWFESNMVSNGGNSGFLTRKEAEVAIRKECPATDAFLAEVQASALEYYANLFKDTVNMDVKHNQEFHKGTLYVADQFRKGAAL
uniref:hypothetical protein n=1 Tax=Citrobacter freundii TaxID=546 RepID=UPI001892283D|nr:hypothetical protein [Citrobacter freundii]